EGEFVALPSPLYIDGDGKQATWVDYDNDGDYDLFVTVYEGYSKLLQNQEGEYVDVSVEAGIPQFLDAFTYGCSWGDYDKDGHLDCYICNYNFPNGHNNWLLHSNGDGTFEEIAMELGVNDGANTTFQSVWIDYNHDSWPDLYIINDKEPANALFKNTGLGTFEDVSESSGAGLVFNPMCIAAADYNDDGMLDIYMTNESYGNRLLRQNPISVFQDYAEQASVEINALTWGATWVDYDNNMNRDLFICSTDFPSSQQNRLMINTGSTFVDGSWLGVDNESHFSYGAAKGDYNNDGYWDLAVSNAGNGPQDLYKNYGGDNNFVKIDLDGTISNTDGIGSWLTWWVQGEEFVDYIFCGESYLSQESHYEIIGIGEAVQIDSILVEWPMGLEEIHYNLPAGSTINLVEGFVPNAQIQSSEFGVCSGLTTELSLAQEFDSYAWSTGDTTAAITVSNPGEYSVSLSYNGGLTTSSSITVEQLTPTQVSFTNTLPSCFGSLDGSIEIIPNSSLDSVVWQNDHVSLMIDSIGSDWWSFTAYETIGCVQQDSVFLDQPDSLDTEFIIEHISCFEANDGMIEVVCDDGNTACSLVVEAYENGSIPPGNHQVTVVDDQGCSFIYTIYLSQPDELIVEIETTAAVNNDGVAQITIEGGTPGYLILIDGEVANLKNSDLAPGIYELLITDDNGCEYETSFTIDQADDISARSRSVIKVYPNPVNAWITIEGLDDNQGENYFIYDSKGALSSSGTVARSPIFVNCSSWSEGTYFFSIPDNKGNSIQIPFSVAH
ncbi:MAG: hypothetical protein HKN32_04510, partial [Flavobacteriales bacterium]|nr:hypothetical protein [Flavobacteriales bacterium]